MGDTEKGIFAMPTKPSAIIMLTKIHSAHAISQIFNLVESPKWIKICVQAETSKYFHVQKS